MMQLDREREEIAHVLRALEHVPWPLRVESIRASLGGCRTARWERRRQLSKLGRRGDWDEIERLTVLTLRDFERPCHLEVLTGLLAGVVAVNGWTAEGEVWICLNLPETPMVLENAAGTFWFYRYRAGQVRTRHVQVGGPAEPAIVGTLGEWGSVSVPASAYEVVLEWPFISELPEFNPGWMPRRQR